MDRLLIKYYLDKYYRSWNYENVFPDLGENVNVYVEKHFNRPFKLEGSYLVATNAPGYGRESYAGIRKRLRQISQAAIDIPVVSPNGPGTEPDKF
jgi:hypothetical protein